MSPASANTSSGRTVLRAYVLTVVAGGYAVLTYCVGHVAHDGVPLEWWMFAALILMSGRITLPVPSVEASFTLSEIFAYTSVLLFGPEAGAVALALDNLVLAGHRRIGGEKTAFNIANLTLAVWSSGTLFFHFSGASPLHGNDGPAGRLILPLALFAGTYFIINTGLVAMAIGLETGSGPFTLWRRHFLRLSAGYAASASLAFLLVAAIQQVHFAAIALLPPILLVFYYMLRSTFGRLEDAQGHLRKLNGLYLSTVETFATAIDAKDEVTHGHIRRVQLAALTLARELDVKDEETLKAIEAAALLHDTGKIAIPEHILNKPGKLTPSEFETMKLHAPIGAEILSGIDFPYPVVPIVRHHHENWDGTGYPDGISGREIPIGARILAVVDCFDALTSDRPYRKRMTEAEALRILHERRGTMYDPVVVDVFSANYQRIMPEPDAAVHRASRAVGRARPALPPRPNFTEADPAPKQASTVSEVLAISSLARAVSGNASICDVGALAWMTLRSVLPASAMALFIQDERKDLLTVAYATGSHASILRQVTQRGGAGVAGWAAVNRIGVLNADPALDIGAIATTLDPPLRSSVTVPLAHDGRVIGVLSCYAASPRGFTEEHLRLLELLAASLAAAMASVAKTEQSAELSRRSGGGYFGPSNVLKIVR